MHAVYVLDRRSLKRPLESFACPNPFDTLLTIDTVDEDSWESWECWIPPSNTKYITKDRYMSSYVGPLKHIKYVGQLKRLKYIGHPSSCSAEELFSPSLVFRHELVSSRFKSRAHPKKCYHNYTESTLHVKCGTGIRVRNVTSMFYTGKKRNYSTVKNIGLGPYSICYGWFDALRYWYCHVFMSFHDLLPPAKKPFMYVSNKRKNFNRRTRLSQPLSRKQII